MRSLQIKKFQFLIGFVLVILKKQWMIFCPKFFFLHRGLCNPGYANSHFSTQITMKKVMMIIFMWWAMGMTLLRLTSQNRNQIRKYILKPVHHGQIGSKHEKIELENLVTHSYQVM